MPEQKTEMARLFDQLRTTHETFTTHSDATKEEIRALGTESAAAKEAYAKINTDLTEIKKKYDELRMELQRPVPADAAVPGATRSFGVIPKRPETAELRSAFIKFIRYGAGESARSMMTVEETRALTSASDADGGFLVTPSFESDLIMAAYDEAELRPICQVGTTGRDTVIMPAMSKPNVAWGILNVSPTAQDLGAGNETLPINDLKALVRIHNNTLDDTEADVVGELLDAFSMAVAEAEDDSFATGPGVNAPEGFMTRTDILANVTNTGVAAALSDATNNGIDAMMDALYGLKKTYRRNATWAFNSTTEGEIRKLKDGEGRYQWQPPVTAGRPATLLGRPMVNPEGMADIAANSYPIGIGDFRKGYKVRDRAGITIQRLVEKYAEYGQTGFLLTRRVGAQSTLAEAFQVVKVAA